MGIVVRQFLHTTLPCPVRYYYYIMWNVYHNFAGWTNCMINKLLSFKISKLCNNLSELSPYIARCAGPCNTCGNAPGIFEDIMPAALPSLAACQHRHSHLHHAEWHCAVCLWPHWRTSRCMYVILCRSLMLTVSLAQNKSETEWKIEWQVSWPRAMAQ